MNRKRWISLLLASFFLIGSMGFAFEPNEAELNEIRSLKDNITPLIENDNPTLRSLYAQARILHPYFKDEKTAYYLEHLRDYLLTKLQARMSFAKNASKSDKTEFLEQYQGSGLENADPIKENCYGWYNTLDMLSFAYDFPTALTIAVWYRESTCGYYLPRNGDGPFQIVSKDYGNGTITREIFETSIIDFLEFAKGKIARYNQRNPESPIQLSYGKINYQDLYKFAGLYNGLSGGTVYGDIGPAAPKYFFEKMPGEFENGKKNGLFLQFLRALEWELQKE